MPADLTETERSVCAAFPVGGWVDLRAGDARQDDLAEAEHWGPDRVIRAEVVTSLLLGSVVPEPGCFPAVRLRGARVLGRVDLMGATVNCALVCEYCCFDTSPRFVEATTRTLRFVSSRIAGFNGARMRVEGIFNLYRTTVSTVMRLDRATVNGEVCLREAVIGEGASEAVSARGLTVDGDLDGRDLVSHGPVALANARISGSVYLAGARITWHGSPALDATNAVIGGGLNGDQMMVHGETRLRRTRIAASIQLPGAQLHNAHGSSLEAEALAVDGGLWCDRGFSALGEMRLAGARLGGSLTLIGAELSAPGGSALNLDRATMAELDARRLVVSSGAVSLNSAQIATDVNLAGARLNGNKDTAFAADGATIGTRLILTNVSARGEISMRTGHIGARLLLQGARIENPGGTALRLSGVEVAADVFCDDITVYGMTRLRGARIGGINLAGARLFNPGSTALDAEALQAARGISLLPAEPVQGTVNLSHASTGVLRDDPHTWPDDLQLGGLSYAALEPQLPARQRLNWLARDPGSRSLQPYQQLAALYANTGQPGQARQVLYAAERRRRSAMSPPGRAWSFLQDITVGYGYRPARAAIWLGALLLIGSLIYAAAPPAPLDLAAAPHFNPVIYTLDLLLPVVDLGQKNSYNPAGFEQWLSYLLTAAGWILATTIATSITRIITRR
jgi:hypothetical protein